MEIRKTEEKDLMEIMTLVQQAKDYFKANSIPQWNSSDGYPTVNQFRSDMAAGDSYVLLDESEHVIATACILSRADPNYRVIENGAWMNDDPYLTVHRLCVRNDLKGHGAAGTVFAYAQELAKKKGICNLRADTHEKNLSMRHALSKAGFIPCGRVYMEDGGPRIGYQKPLVLR